MEPGDLSILPALSRAAARLSSNSVLLQAPERFVVVDAGGEPELLRRHLETIGAAQPKPAIPVCFVQTHVHIDHIAGLTDFGPLPGGWPYELAAHSEGLRLLRQADTTATLAELTGRSLRPFRPAGWRVWTVQPKPGGTAREPDRVLPLGGDSFLEAFCTPGHSPDSVTWRAGPHLFVGDLLAATAPLVAGIPGWNQKDLLISLDRLERIMEAGGILQVHVGHGPPLDPVAVAEAIARSRREAGGLVSVAPVDANRVREMAAYAEGLTRELEELFAEMAGRIARLADHLTQLQEHRAADDVRGIDRSHEVRELLAAFARFKEASPGRGDGGLGVAVKGVQTVQRISHWLAWDRFDEVLDASFLRFVRTRVVDFIQRAKGLAPAQDLRKVDLGEIVRAHVKRLRGQQDGAFSLDGTLEGERGFRRQLVHGLSRRSSLGPVPLDLALAEGPLAARLDSGRFGDALTRLLEEAVGKGATRLSLRIDAQADQTWLELHAEGGAWSFDAPLAAVWAHVFARAGARIRFPDVSSCGMLTLVFDA